MKISLNINFTRSKRKENTAHYVYDTEHNEQEFVHHVHNTEHDEQEFAYYVHYDELTEFNALDTILLCLYNRKDFLK